MAGQRRPRPQGALQHGGGAVVLPGRPLRPEQRDGACRVLGGRGIGIVRGGGGRWGAGRGERERGIGKRERGSDLAVQV